LNESGVVPPKDGIDLMIDDRSKLMSCTIEIIADGIETTGSFP
jgi:hypothetical protein